MSLMKLKCKFDKQKKLQVNKRQKRDVTGLQEQVVKLLSYISDIYDLALASENQSHFEEYCSNNLNVSPVIDLTTVLTTGVWPNGSDSSIHLKGNDWEAENAWDDDHIRDRQWASRHGHCTPLSHRLAGGATVVKKNSRTTRVTKPVKERT
ncbi:hypothetical protein QVD17_06991 [Tagetes erecta]|uniref:Uncharacterized protein n=1 Tax=Tagetes erecta TaxID=13708 RepID=A0AAD8PCK2_TARER|nr:hypothetical protein QVD17_06991 [Tagetes erecta]